MDSHTEIVLNNTNNAINGWYMIMGLRRAGNDDGVLLMRYLALWHTAGHVAGWIPGDIYPATCLSVDLRILSGNRPRTLYPETTSG